RLRGARLADQAWPQAGGERALAQPAGDRQGAGARSREGRAARSMRGAVAADDRLVHPVRGREAARRIGEQVALAWQADRTRERSTIPLIEPVALKTVLLTAVLNPVVVLVALWMGSSASQWQKVP